MKIKFLGTGGAFEPTFGNSAAILEINRKNILIDAGFTVYPKLSQLGLWQQLDYIVLTHLHNDHCGSLANILLHTVFYGNGRKPIILYQTEDFRNQIIQFLNIQLKDAEKYAEFKLITEIPGLSYLDTYNRHSENFQTYSFVFEESGERLVYSGDLGDCHFLFDFLGTLPALPTQVYHDISFDHENKGHAYYTDLKAYQAQYFILGYHCDATQKPFDNTIPLVYDQAGLCY
ncbi:MBL fold metallo-hydrolase [Adhaeribacter arboris]|uniref:MBL fold metallo-hydrolase n=1 Tax=Adhaeribacter arboris TaxID=2072846 RepID=A0A2T2YFP2_9BACT|nr:MBL fold metallo-hydrolase [Adhaeribacter arboris]PSR54331.1 MBL fold metallo-hydrolase [Adhaeribacter arboris]